MTYEEAITKLEQLNLVVEVVDGRFEVNDQNDQPVASATLDWGNGPICLWLNYLAMEQLTEDQKQVLVMVLKDLTQTPPYARLSVLRR